MVLSGNLPNYPIKNYTHPKPHSIPINQKQTHKPNYLPSQNYPRNPNHNQHPTPHKNSNNQNHENTRRLTDREFQERKSKGLCFRCDEKWKLGHVCRRKELSVLIVGDAEEDDEILEEEDEVFEDAESRPIGISLNSVVGIDNPKTMKLEGKIEGSKVVVMIDPGATRKFIAPRVVEKLAIPITTSEEFGVTLGTGETRLGKGKCQGVELHLGALCITENFLPLELGHSDVILGIEWLAKLGTISTNWKTPMMQFNWNGSKIISKGDPSLERSLVTLKSIMQEIRQLKGGVLIELNSIEQDTGECLEELPKNVPGQLQEVVDMFGPVFNMPSGLPPLRSKQHHITLKNGSNPVSVRPYRYPQIQKEEIERLVADMLQAGIIQPSLSPFSSPVLLVKKKDDSWRFCVDYRA